MKIRPVDVVSESQRGCRSATRPLITFLAFSRRFLRGAAFSAPRNGGGGNRRQTKELMAAMYGVFFIFLLGRAILSFVTMVKSGLGEWDKRKTWRRTRGGRGWRKRRKVEEWYFRRRARAKLLARDGMRMLLVRCAAADERSVDATRVLARRDAPVWLWLLFRLTAPCALAEMLVRRVRHRVYDAIGRDVAWWRYVN